jgi:multiple sugar transport system permease protein
VEQVEPASRRALHEAPLRGASPHPRTRRSLLDRDGFLGPVMILPAVLYVVALIGVPFFLSLYLALTDAKIASSRWQFVGLANFESAIQSPTFRRALVNTFLFTLISQALVLVLGKILATCLQQDFHGKSVLRFLILLPWVAPISLGTIGWKWMLDSLYSPVNWVLRALHVVGPNDWPMWFGESYLAMASVIGVHVWRLLPFSTVIILAGLTSIPREVTEAADVDGAGFWSREFHIILPLLRPILTVAALFGIIFAFTDMTVIYVLTRGGPADATQVLSSLAFFTGILGGDLAGGAAISLFLFPILLVVAIIMLRVARRAEVT